VSTSPSFRKNSSIVGPRVAEYIPIMSSSSVRAIVLLMLSHEAVRSIRSWTLSMCASLSTFGLRSTMNELGIGAPCVVGNASSAERFVFVPEPMEPGVYVNNGARNRGGYVTYLRKPRRSCYHCWEKMWTSRSWRLL
jgi:hypothetical protein